MPYASVLEHEQDLKFGKEVKMLMVLDISLLPLNKHEKTRLIEDRRINRSIKLKSNKKQKDIHTERSIDRHNDIRTDPFADNLQC